MGRLPKKKIDAIAKLRKQGDLQKEVAEKLGIHIRTVQKYDPTRVAVKRYPAVNDLTESIREVLPIILNWLSVLSSWLLSEKKDICNCPMCLTDSFEYDWGKDMFICRECGYRLIVPEHICFNCFATNRMNFDYDSHTWECRKCGVRRD